MSKLWSGRFAADTNEAVQRFTESVSYDQRLAKQDIRGSIAHASGLLKAKILTQNEYAQIKKGLFEIEKEIISGKFKFQVELEDVHMNIESALTKKIGPAAKKLHTGRSRNDQVATDMRLYVRDEITALIENIRGLCEVLLDLADKNQKAIMPGFTHLQIAQPILLAHHFLAYVEMLIRDRQRLEDVYKRVNISPLGSAALAGTVYKIDRVAVAKELGFAGITENSLDAVSDRDFLVELLSASSLIMIHLSRLAEEVIIWNSTGFKFIELADGFATGSSIMPQKKNPDIAELVRGKTGRVCGSLTGLLMTIKGLPLAYNRDLQEDKEQVFDAVDTVKSSLELFAGLLATAKFNTDNMYKAASDGYSTATDLADYLVGKGIPFRAAHEITGKIVNYAISKNKKFSDLKLNEFQQFSTEIKQDVFAAISLEASVNARDIYGGTAPKQVAAALKRARKRI